MKRKLKVPIYDSIVNVIKVKNLKELESKYNLVDCDGYDAFAFRITNKKKVIKYYVAFEGNPKIDVVHHEVTHLVNLIFNDAGVKLDIDNDETQAYFSAFLFRKVLKKLKLMKLKKAK